MSENKMQYSHIAMLIFIVIDHYDMSTLLYLSHLIFLVRRDSWIMALIDNLKISR